MKPRGFVVDRAALLAVAVRIAIVLIIALTGVASAHV
jgi:hypothetical protein